MPDDHLSPVHARLCVKRVSRRLAKRFLDVVPFDAVELVEGFAQALALIKALEKRIEDEMPATPNTPRKLRGLLQQKEACYRGMRQNEKADAIRNAFFPPRPGDLDIKQIDLSKYFNTSLDDKAGWSKNPDNILIRLPESFAPLKGVGFDLRGIVQLESGILPEGMTRNQMNGTKYPTGITGIPVGECSPAIHFLTSCQYGLEARGVEVARFVMHYADGSSETMPVKFLDDIADWLLKPGENIPKAKIGWRGTNAANRASVLSELVWKNPHPEKVIESIDFISAQAKAAPFLLGITLE